MPDKDQNGASRSQPDGSATDKERSRQLSRSVSPRETARASGARRGSGQSSKRGSGPGGGSTRGTGTSQRTTGNAQRRAAQRSGSATTATKARKPRGPGGRASTARARRSNRSVYTWVAVGVVVVIVAVVVLVSQLGGSGANAEATPAPAAVAHDVTTVPTSVYDTVGVTSSSTPIDPPTVLTGEPPLTFTVGGKTLPGVFYYGAEFCPYCAAERWAFAATLARFGTLSNLYVVRSNSSDVYPSTATLSFVHASFSSPYFAVKTVEGENVNHDTLQTPTKEEVALVEKYDTSKYVNGLSSEDDGSIPFIDFGNKVLIAGASYNPAVLTGLDQEHIAADLHDASSPVTQAIIATSNYQSAAICSLTKGQPGSVCDTSGVQAAAKALKISF